MNQANKFCDKMSKKHQVANLKSLTEKGNDLFHNYLPNHACQTQIYKVLVMTALPPQW